MLIYVGIALIMTLLIGYLFETLKMRMTLFALKRINQEILNVLSDAKFTEEVVDVFMVEKLREMFRERLLRSHVFDDFKIYKKDNRNIQMSYKKNMAVQNLELHIEPFHCTLTVGATEYFENPFEEIHL